MSIGSRALALLGLSLLVAGCGSGGSPDPAAPASSEPVEETVELVLTARDVDDQPLGLNGRAGVTVGVGEPFLLDVRYVDHRPEQDRIGAAQVFVDLLADQADVLRPVVAETFRLIVGEEIRAIAGSGTVAFSIETRQDVFTTTGTAFVADPEAELTAALAQFGYRVGEDYVLTRLQIGNDIGLQIHWAIDRHGNTDMPDLMLSLSFPSSVPSQTIEFAPLNPDGSVNTSALPFNLDTRNRSLVGRTPFYDDAVSVNFNAAEGFRQIGGMGPAAVGGIPELHNVGALPQPFHAFSVWVMVVAPVNGLTIRAAPSEAGETIVMYGTPDDVPEDDIRTDGDHALTLDAEVR